MSDLKPKSSMVQDERPQQAPTPGEEGVEREKKKAEVRERYDDDHVEHTEKSWEKAGVAAHDSEGNMYIVMVSDNEVLYVPIGGPRAVLVYSRAGDVIGYIGTDKGVHLHEPSNGWGELDISNVGTIANRFEGDGTIPDFSKYKTPETKVEGKE